MARDEQQLRVFAAALDAIVRPGERIFEIVRNVFVELAVLLVGDVRFIARPEGVRLVDRFPLSGLDLLGLILVPFFFQHFNRDRNVIGVVAQDGAQLGARQEFVLVSTQMQHDVRAPAILFDWGHGKFALTVRRPFDGLVSRQPGAAASYGDPIGDDKRRVKAHAKLAD